MFKVEANLKEIATRQLTQRRARKEGEARRPVTTVNCKALHGLQFRATVEGHSFISDEGDEAGGHDAGPAPLRYFLAGIMMCHQVWCVKSSAVADVQLISELRSFEISTPTNEALVEMSVKIVSEANGRIVNARIFRARVPTASVDAANAARALDHALSVVMLDIVRWVSGSRLPRREATEPSPS